MMTLPKLVSAEPVGGYRLRLAYSDGFVGTVDLADTVAKGGIFTFMADPLRFRKVTVAHHGASLQWIDDDGDEIDLDAEAQRMKAEADVVASLAGE